MALLLYEGFDIYGYDAVTLTDWLCRAVHWQRDHQIYGMWPHIDPTEGRKGRGCLAVQTNSNSGSANSCVRCLLDGEPSTAIVGFAMKEAAGIYSLVDSLCYPGFALLNGDGDYQLSISRTAAYAIQVRSGGVAGSVIATSANGVLVPGVWQFIEIKAVSSVGAGSIVVNVDGVEVINQGSVNTRYAADGNYALVQLSNWHMDGSNVVSGHANQYDDFYACDDSGPAPYNAFLGDWYVTGYLPTTDGSQLDWTSTQAAHHDSINVIGAGYDTDYIESGTETDQDSYLITPDPMASIAAVEIVAICENTSGGTAKMTPYVYIGGNFYYGDEVQLAAGTPDYRGYVWVENPATTSPWVKADLDTAEFGWEVTDIS
jgi:hypothetical protein